MNWMVSGILLVLSFQMGGCKSLVEEKPITILGASSATDLVLALGTAFEMEHNQPVQASFASSSTLARHIAGGAEFDFFISADPKWVNFLKSKNPGKFQSRQFLFNQMVLISSKDPIDVNALSDLPMAPGLIAVGNPDHVPAGNYAKISLQHLGLWSAIEPRLVPTSNVREALRLVQTGECEFGIVYHSDALLVKKAGIPLPLPEGTEIGYQIMWRKDLPTTNQKLFLEYMYSPAAKELSLKMGFEWQNPLEGDE